MNYILLNPTLDSKSAIAQDLHTAAPPADTTLIPEVLESIRVGLRDVALENALNIRQLAQGAVEQVLRIGQRLWRMKLDLKRKEYGVFLRFLGWTTTKAGKYINLAKTFDGFELSKLFGIELTTLFSLCSSRYQEVVAQLKEIPDISQELVEQLMKQNRPQRKPQSNPISGWKQSRSGGGRYYNVLLHNEVTGVSIEQQAEAEGILPQKVIEEAIALRSQHKSSDSVQLKEYRAAQLEELHTVVDHARTLDRENRKLAQELHKRDLMIAELEAKLTERVAAPEVEPDGVQKDEVTVASTELNEYLEAQVSVIAPLQITEYKSQTTEVTDHLEVEQKSSCLKPAYQPMLDNYKEWDGDQAQDQIWEVRAKELGLVLDYTTIGQYTVRHNYRKLGTVIQKYDINNNSWWENRRQISSIRVDDGDCLRYDTPESAAIALANLMGVTNEGGRALVNFFGGGYEPQPEQLIEAHQEFIEHINQEARCS